jgi:hypothetical protein
VAYCMQAKQLPGLRATAQEFLRTGLPQQARYFRRRRLAALDLPIPELAVPDLAWEAGEPEDAEASGGALSGAAPSGTRPPDPSPARAPRLYPRALLRIGRAGQRRLAKLRKLGPMSRLGPLGTRLRPEHHHAPGAE